MRAKVLVASMAAMPRCGPIAAPPTVESSRVDLMRQREDSGAHGTGHDYEPRNGMINAHSRPESCGGR
jgi:hypothetical protein